MTVWIAGGLGNQLFQYAAARRLALRNDVPLRIDNWSGFSRDPYQRRYLLDRFQIRGETIAPGTSYASTWGRLRRKIRVRANQSRRLEDKTYLVEQQRWFDPRMLALKVTRPIYLQGYWQDENYFADIRDLLLEELTLRAPHDAQNVEIAEKIGSVEAVCLHVRRLHGATTTKDAVPLAAFSQWHHVEGSYFQKAVDLIAQKVVSPHFFVFADYSDPNWVEQQVRTAHPIEFVTHNGTDKDYEDFWLMGQCRHFIIANSTFSWWAAWLGRHPGKIVIAPEEAIGRMITSVPPSWIQV